MYIYRRIMPFMILCVFPLLISGQGLNYPKFLETTGMEIVAQLAHPLKYEQGLFLPEKSKCIILNSEFYFVLHYKDEGWTMINFKQEKGIIKSASLYNTNYLFSAPFATVEILFPILLENETNMKGDPLWNQVVKYYSGVFGKEFNQFNGYELAIVALAWKWGVALSEEERGKNRGSIGQLPGQITRIIDGIKVIGTPEFTRKVEEALKIVQNFDANTYENYFKTKVKTITYQTSKSFSTIGDNGTINLSSVYTHFNHDNIFNANGYVLAGTLLHEMTHLYQWAEYSKLYNCSMGGFIMSYAYDPIENAKLEIKAYNVSNVFFENILKRVTREDNVVIYTSASDTKKKNDTSIEHYKILSMAGTYLFKSRIDNPDCGSSCMSMYRNELENFGSKHPAFVPTVNYLKWLYP